MERNFFKGVAYISMLTWLGSCGTGVYLLDEKLNCLGAFCFLVFIFMTVIIAETK